MHSPGLQGTWLVPASSRSPPTPQDLVLARLHGALDGGAVEHPWNLNANLRLQATPPENPGSVQGATPSHQGTWRYPKCPSSAQVDDQY
jgi:hypothetical protein